MDRDNKIYYQQAYQICEKLQDNFFANKVFSFLKMLVLIKKIQSNAYATLKIDESSEF